MLLNSWAKFVSWIYRCWRDPVKRLALLAAVLTLGCLAILAGPPFFSTASVPERWPSSPALEVESVTGTEDLRLTLGDAPSQDRETMRLKTEIDFAFIAAYVTLLVSMGLLLAREGGWKRVAGVTAAILALAAGVFDVLENLAILDILDVRVASTTETMMAAIRQPSRTKWLLLAVCAACLLPYLLNFRQKAKR
jgi:hypothetical protein